MAGVLKKILESYGIAATVKMTSTARVVVALPMVIVVDVSVKIGSIVVKFVIEMETANRMFALNRDVLNEIRSCWGDHADSSRCVRDHAGQGCGRPASGPHRVALAEWRRVLRLLLSDGDT